MLRVALASTLKQLEAQRQYGVFQAFVLSFFYPWHVKQLKTTLSKSVFYQIILQASSFEIPGSLLALAHTARGLAQAETPAQPGGPWTQRPTACKAQQHRFGFAVLLYCREDKRHNLNKTNQKKKPPRKARMQTLVKRTCCPPLSFISMKKMNFIHRNRERQVLIPAHYYKYKAASPYSCKAGLDSM